MASGLEPYSNYGLELSRGFRALKVWLSLKEHGIEKYKRLIRQNIAQSQYLVHLINEHQELELLAPVPLNIVCFRFNADTLSENELNELNKEILIQLQVRGIASPSYSLLNGKYAIRVAHTNHRSRKEDFELLVKSVIQIACEILVKVD